MRKPILITRTVSIEKLAPVLAACTERWPTNSLWVVSSPARCEEVGSDPRVDRVLPYDGGASGFEKEIVIDEALEALVIPVSNEKGSGYGNVLRACRGLESKKYALCSRCASLTFMSRPRFQMKWRFESGIRFLANLVSGFWADRILENE